MPTEQERFARCLEVVLLFEGGFSDDPRDNGNATNFGITLRTLARWRGREVVAEDVRQLTEDEAAAIYRAQYWHVTGCDQLPPGLDLITFDCAVNQGTAIAGRFLQQACGVSIDGIVGPRTIQAARTKAAASLINAVSQYRAERYRATANFETFGKGWLRRLAEVTALSLADAAPSGGDLTRQALEA
jgi:lysozyme family protein